MAIFDLTTCRRSRFTDKRFCFALWFILMLLWNNRFFQNLSTRKNYRRNLIACLLAKTSGAEPTNVPAGRIVLGFFLYLQPYDDFNFRGHCCGCWKNVFNKTATSFRLFQPRNILFLLINAFGKFSISREKIGMMLICNI